MNLILEFLFSYLASFFFALSSFAKRKTVFIAPLVGAIGHLIFTILSPNSEMVAAFVSTFFCCVMAEILARVMKTSATGVSLVAVIPLVPGVMLYETMHRFIEGNTIVGVQTLAKTLLYAGMMAVGVTFAALLGRFVVAPIYKKTVNGK